MVVKRNKSLDRDLWRDGERNSSLVAFPASSSEILPWLGSDGRCFDSLEPICLEGEQM